MWQRKSHRVCLLLALLLAVPQQTASGFAQNVVRADGVVLGKLTIGTGVDPAHAIRRFSSIHGLGRAEHSELQQAVCAHRNVSCTQCMQSLEVNLEGTAQGIDVSGFDWPPLLSLHSFCRHRMSHHQCIVLRDHYLSTEAQPQCYTHPPRDVEGGAQGRGTRNVPKNTLQKRAPAGSQQLLLGQLSARQASSKR